MVEAELYCYALRCCEAGVDPSFPEALKVSFLVLAVHARQE